MELYRWNFNENEDENTNEKEVIVRLENGIVIPYAGFEIIFQNL